MSEPASLRIMAVEDERLQAMALRHLFTALGYDLVGIAASADEALTLFDEQKPDLVLLDIRLRGERDGVDLALELNQRRPVPLIFVTSYPDRATFDRAKQAGPFAFLSKPYDADVLARSIELAVQHFAQAQGASAAAAPDDGLLTNGAFFVRQNGRLQKVVYADVQWVEADGSYTHLHTAGPKYTLRLSMRELEEKLPTSHFIRVHRGAIVQLTCIDRVDARDHEIVVGENHIPIGRAYRDELMRRIKQVV